MKMPSTLVGLCVLIAPTAALQASAMGVRHAPRPRFAAAVRLQAPSEDFTDVHAAADAISAAAPVARGSDLVAANDGRRVAVSGLTPDASSSTEQQAAPAAGVAQPAPAPAPTPSFMQKAKAPFLGVTVAALAGVTVWQSKIKLARRQQALLDEFAATMVFHMGDAREMEETLKDFRKQLGPGRFTSKMYVAFLKAAATSVPLGVAGVQNLKAATTIFKLSDDASASLLEAAADDLSSQPSVLGKLTFLAERAMPTAAAAAKLRTKFPNWSFETVTALQRAMLETLYRDLSSDGNSLDAASLAVLGLSAADAARIDAEVAEEKAEAERIAEEKRLEEERAAKLEEALMRAASGEEIKRARPRRRRRRRRRRRPRRRRRRRRAPPRRLPRHRPLRPPRPQRRPRRRPWRPRRLLRRPLRAPGVRRSGRGDHADWRSLRHSDG